MVQNPAEMFELTKFGKTVGYVEAPVNNTIIKNDNTGCFILNYNFLFLLLNHVECFYDVCRGNAHTDAALCVAGHESDHADDVVLRVHKRTARVAVVEGGIGLDHFHSLFKQT